MPISLGQQLGEYQIQQRLGQGAFGTVYLAQDIHLGRLVAIKELSLASRQDETNLKRFIQEARTAGNLNHPNIVTVHGLKFVEEDIYLVMEYLPRGSLRQRLDHAGQLPIAEVSNLAADICDGLAAAHEQFIIHRDIKPENILLSETGQAKISDFGIAHVPDGLHLTQTGFQPGTMIYMSPEQIRGKQIDSRSDVYQVGALLYEMLAGTHYIDVEQLALRAKAVARSNMMRYQARFFDLLDEAICELEPVRIDQIRPEVPPHLVQLVSVLLAKKADERPTTAELGKKLGSNGGRSYAAGLSPDWGYSVPKNVRPTKLPKSSTDVPVIVVSKSGGGQFWTIGEAVRNAHPSARILVRPGRYIEEIIIDKPLEIIGDGPSSEVIIEGIDSSCIVMQTDKAVVRNLTLRGQIGLEKIDSYVVEIPQGQLVLEDCDIVSNSLACVAVYNNQADPIIRRCKIHNGQQYGILFWSSARGRVEDCNISDNRWPGIAITQNSNPVVHQCQIHDNETHGIWVTKDGQGIIEDCDIFNNGYSGVAIVEGGNPDIRRCKVYDCNGSGIWITEKGRGLVEECEIFDNSKAGIAISKGSNPSIRSCRIHSGNNNGIWVSDGGQGLIEDCEIFKNAYPGVAIVEGGNPVIRQCKIYDGNSHGILITEIGQGTFKECEIFGNASVGIGVSRGGDPRVQQCSIGGDNLIGIWVTDRGRGSFQKCDISGNRDSGVTIDDRGEPILSHCRIRQNSVGVKITKDSACILENCEIIDNTNGAWEVESGAQVIVEEARKEDQPATTIEGFISRIIYCNPENNFVVARFSPDGQSESVTIVGLIDFAHPGMSFMVEGYWSYAPWKLDPNYDQQFDDRYRSNHVNDRQLRIIQAFARKPVTQDEISRLLRSGFLKAIGPVMAKRVVAKFGDKTLDIIENDISSLFTVDGIGPKRVHMIKRSWDELKQQKGSPWKK